MPPPPSLESFACKAAPEQSHKLARPSLLNLYQIILVQSMEDLVYKQDSSSVSLAQEIKDRRSKDLYLARESVPLVHSLHHEEGAFFSGSNGSEVTHAHNARAMI